jgi:hypothetical protein
METVKDGKQKDRYVDDMIRKPTVTMIALITT